MKKLESKKVIFLFLVVVAILLVATGCAGFQNSLQEKGGLVSTKGDYVVLNESGGKIMDVWVLRNVYVQSEDKSDGWNFIDSSGNAIMIGGDTKVIRANSDKSILNHYVDYHYEINGGDYYDYAKSRISLNK